MVKSRGVLGGAGLAQAPHSAGDYFVRAAVIFTCARKQIDYSKKHKQNRTIKATRRPCCHNELKQQSELLQTIAIRTCIYHKTTTSLTTSTDTVHGTADKTCVYSTEEC